MVGQDWLVPLKGMPLNISRGCRSSSSLASLLSVLFVSGWVRGAGQPPSRVAAHCPLSVRVDPEPIGGVTVTSYEEWERRTLKSNQYIGSYILPSLIPTIGKRLRTACPQCSAYHLRKYRDLSHRLER